MFGLFKKKPIISLEEQLSELEKLGFKLDDGVSIEDMLHSFPKADYEKDPYQLTLAVLGFCVEKEPWNQPFCSKVWNFDAECIEDHGSYTDIVKNFCRVSENIDRITNIRDYVDIEEGKAWLKYTIDDKEKHFDIPIHDDWVDETTVYQIARDCERGSKKFYAMDNGQASVLFYINKITADRLNKLSKTKLSLFL